jgi:hypothetical protein
MRPCSAALAAFLADTTNKEAIIVDLYTFALTDGSTLRYSGWTSELTVPSASFPTGSINAGAGRVFSLGPPFGRSKVSSNIGVDPTELELSIFAGEDDTIGTFKFAEAVRMGLFDGATVELDRLFSPPTETSGVDTATLGCLVWFYGRVSESEIGRTRIDMKVKSLLDLLSTTQFPRRIYQSSCNHVFGGAMCGYDRVLGKNALGAATGVGATTITAATGTTQGLINAGAAVPIWLQEGTITGLTGANTGISRTIANTGDETQIGLFRAFLHPIAVGDTFTALPGCPHTSEFCDITLNNLGRYGGFMHIPPPENAI